MRPCDESSSKEPDGTAVAARPSDYRWQLRKDEGAMRPWIDWLARVGVAGAWIMAAGGGGGDVSDPGSDSQAGSDAAPEGGGAPLAPPAAAQAPAAAAGPMRGRPGMMAAQK